MGVTTLGAIYYWNGSAFVEAGGGGCATDIAVGPASAPLAGPFGDVWIIGCTFKTNGYRIYQYQFGANWPTPAVALPHQHHVNLSRPVHAPHEYLLDIRRAARPGDQHHRTGRLGWQG
jgi:hypothetical protein